MNKSEIIPSLGSYSHGRYVSGEVIVKFKSTSTVSIKAPRATRFKTSGATEIDKIFTELGVAEVEELMPLSGNINHNKAARAFNGAPVKAPDMQKIYRIRLNGDADIIRAINKINELEDIEYAEPNFIMHSLGYDSAEPNDPYYSLQYGLFDINMPKLWGQPVLTKEGPIIAILDTGVDITHPDLKANIWQNESEVYGAGAYDDDNNGFIDDINGWDFINGNGYIRDGNGHGTHCAGIAAASGYNSIGIIGANPYARIMPVTVMQSSGVGDVATIIRGIDYASANGADIISMSLGGYDYSLALEQALARAFQKSIIVAAAGNDGECLNHAHPERGQNAPSAVFPAAFNFVLGVQASDAKAQLASFTNYDDNGPVLSVSDGETLYNYEITAPGVSIISTYPGGGYKELSGTSMATPLVAGAISRLLQCKKYDSKELLFGDLINSVNTNGVLDIANVYNIKDSDRRPVVSLVSYRFDDSKTGDDDGRPDAGETVYIYPKFRNTWGQAKNIRYNLKLDAAEDPKIAEILDNYDAWVLYQLGTYGTVEAQVPVAIKINPNCADGSIIKFILSATYDGMTAPLSQEIFLIIENGVEIGGVIKENMTLTADKNYIVTSTLAVPKNVTLTIEPGTVLKFRNGADLIVADDLDDGEYLYTDDNHMLYYHSYFRNAGKVIAKGTPEKKIVFTTDGRITDEQSKKIDFGYNSELEYCHFTGFSPWGSMTLVLSDAYYPATKITNVESLDGTSSIIFKGTGYARHCTVDNIRTQYADTGLRYGVSFLNDAIKYCNFYDIQYTQNNNWFVNANMSNYSNVSNPTLSGHYGYAKNSYNNYISNYDQKSGGLISVIYDSNEPMWLTPENGSYLGTSDYSKAAASVKDITHGYYYGDFDVSNMLTRPLNQAHGIVWKVVVNGYDAQDQTEYLPALGVGKHKFEVYFNRKMNHQVRPTICMGVRTPFTQTAIAENGSWRSEKMDNGDIVDVYTAYLTINGRSNYDGINRIYVAGAQDDEYFEIPVENKRFSVNVQAAGSLSEGFSAEAGLGRVILNWENSEESFADMLGYNLYRYSINDHREIGDTIKINTAVIEAQNTNYVDYDVTPGTTYCYYYKVMRTNLNENAPSKIVAITPLTATAGDANGSGDVDVADVITTVNFAAGMSPRPFIFEAADMNKDSEIDILDIVGIIRTILSPNNQNNLSIESSATYTIEDGIVYLDTPVELSGLQFNILMPSKEAAVPSDILKEFEQTGAWISDNEYLFIAYSLSGKRIAPGRYPILSIGENSEIKSVKLSDPYGSNVTATFDNIVSCVESIETLYPESTGIYNITGIKLGEDISILNNLPSGIYIVNGKKIVK